MGPRCTRSKRGGLCLFLTDYDTTYAFLHAFIGGACKIKMVQGATHLSNQSGIGRSQDYAFMDMAGRKKFD